MSKKPNITKEIVEKVLYLDCTTDEGVRRLEKSLMKLPFIKSEEDLQTDKLEEFIKKIEVRNMIHLAYIMRSVVDMQDMYSGMIKTDLGDLKGRWLETVHAKTVWETLAKTVFYMYYYLESGKKPKKRG